MLLVKNHSVLPHIKVAQSTKEMDWNNVELRVFSTDYRSRRRTVHDDPAAICKHFRLFRAARSFVLRQDPQAGKVKWTIKLQTLTR